MPDEIELEIEPVFHFVQGGPFFELVATFTAACAGLTPVFDGANYPDFLHGTHGYFHGFIAGNVGTDLGLQVKQARQGAIDAGAAEIGLCCMLANAAFERMVRTHEATPMKHPTVQFFRHVRNAASHHNLWHFLDPSGKPARLRPAAWRGFEIDHTRKGTENPLHGKQCFGVAVGTADLLALLSDIEQLQVAS